MLSNIQQAFDGKALIAYITLGDPSTDFTLDCCKALIDSGVDIIEIGLPFSDPIADGPTIQAAHSRALATGKNVSISAAFQLSGAIKQYQANIPVVFMGATNLVMQYGFSDFFSQAKQRGCDGLILPDSSLEMTLSHLDQAKAENIDIIQLISPLCSKQRMEAIMKRAQGFVYLISSTGITGERDDFNADLSQFVAEMKQISSIPIAVGFGVSKPEHCRDLCQFSDGVIIGSHFAKLIQQHLPNKKQALQELKKRAAKLKAAC